MLSRTEAWQQRILTVASVPSSKAMIFGHIERLTDSSGYNETAILTSPVTENLEHNLKA